MFSKISRYRKLPDEVSTDVRGRSLSSKTLRPLPEVSGDFLHTVEELDRLDHLAYKYYKQPRKWWRICDANLAFMSPQALLGKEPIVTDRFPLTWDDEAGPTPVWSVLLSALSNTVGVLDAGMGTSEQPFPEVQILGGALLFAIDVGLVADLNVGVLTQELSSALRQALQDEGLTLAAEVKVSSVDENRWRITDQVSRHVYTFRLEAGSLNVYENVVHHTWTVTVTYNRMNVSAETLADLITATGFGTSQAERIGRVGKQVIIPPDSVR